VRRIGVLMSVDENDPEGKAQLSGFTQGLAELGWTDGRNLRMELRWGPATSIGYGFSQKSWSRCSRR
jgi:putative ABC transport system substrate-binding protein